VKRTELRSEERLLCQKRDVKRCNVNTDICQQREGKQNDANSDMMDIDVTFRVIPVEAMMLFSSVGNVPICMPPGDYSFGSHIRVVDWSGQGWPLLRVVKKSLYVFSL
jgi:hypothetical protein